MQPMQLCFLSDRRFEKTFENAHWRKLNKCNQCDNTPSLGDNFMMHLKTQWRKVLNMIIHMLCMWIENLDFLNKCIVHTELCQSVSCDMICHVRYNSNLFLCRTKKDNFQNMLILNWIDSNAIECCQ